MATTTPIDVERYLLQGEGEPGLDLRDYLTGAKQRPGAPATKPDLDDALLQHYNATAPKPLAPGELPPPVPQPEEPPGLLERAAGAAANIPSTISGAVSAARNQVQIPPDVISAQPRPEDMRVTGGDVLNRFNTTIKKHASFVRDTMEAGGTVLADLATGAVGAGLKVSNILNATLARVASGKPFTGQPESPTFYRDLMKQAEDTVANITYDPKSDIAKTTRGITSKIFNVFHEISMLPARGLVATGVIDEDTAEVVGFATELFLLHKLDRGVRNAAPELRAKIANFRSKSRSGSEADVAAAAEDLANAASRNPRLEQAMDEARSKFRDEADREAGRPPRPKGPDEGPAGGGEAIDPADLTAYTEALRQRTAEFQAAHPEGYSISDLQAELNRVPKPQPRPAPEAPTTEAARPAYTAEPTRPTAEAPINTVSPSGELTLRPDLANYAAEQLRSGVDVAQVVRNLRPSVRGEISDASIREAVRAIEFANRQAPRAPEVAATTTREGMLPPSPPGPAVVAAAPTEAAATVAPETVPAPVSPEPPPVAAVTPTTDVVLPPRPIQEGTYREVAQRAIEAINDPNVTTADRTSALSTLKREALDLVPGSTERGLRQLGVDEETIQTLLPELHKLRAPKAGTETLQQVAEKPSSRQGYFGWEGTHTAESAISRAQELGILNIIRTELNQGVTVDDVAGIARQKATGRIQRGEIQAVVEAIRNNPEAALAPLRDMLNTGKLAELKSLARDAAEGGNLITGLTRLGFPREEVRAIAEQLRTVRAKKAGTETLQQVAEQPTRTVDLVPGIPDDVYGFLAREGQATVTAISRRAGLTYPEVNEALRRLQAEGRVEAIQGPSNFRTGPETVTRYRAKPAVQTAATEAVLENAPAGTEVEIPAPAEPVVDTSPAIEKPKRKRRVVKARDEAQVARETYAEQEIQMQRGLHEQQENQRQIIERQLQGTSVSLEDASRILTDAFNRGMGPANAWELLPGVPPDAAFRAANIAYDLHVHGNTINRPPVTMRGWNAPGYVEIGTLEGLRSAVGTTSLPSRNAEPVRAPIQVRTAGGKPDAIFIDTTGMNSRSSLADIERQVARGQTSPEVAQVLRASLQRQADIAGLPIERAQEFNGQELTQEATRLAAQNDLDLYVRKGKNYELVPKDVVRTDARLNRGDDLAPTPISKETAGAYVESKTSNIGPAQVREILDAIEKGVDITDRLPSELVPHYRAMRDTERAGIDTSERRAFVDMLVDLNTMLGEQGTIGGQWTRDMRMAAQRLQADMRKLGKSAREFLFGARPEDVAVFEKYLDTIQNPVPPDSTNPRNMRFDPENVIPGDKVVKHRTVSKAQQLNAVPLWESEVKGIQNAREIPKAGGTHWDIRLPIRQHKAAGTEFLYYAYRTAQKNLNAEINTLHSDMQELGRGFSSKSLENLGANGYARQGPDGQRILTYNNVTPKPLTPAERRLQATGDGIYRATHARLEEVRAATGRDPLPYIDDYQTFARTISLLNHLGIKVDLARDSAAEINAKYIKHKATNFPYVVRKHAFYTAEMNYLKILDTYMQSALKDIHMSPFIAKMNELIDTLLPDPVTGKEDWALKDHKPKLYNELRAWTDYIATGTNLQIPDTPRIILNTLNNNIAYATLSGLFRSSGIQLSTLVNTSYAVGGPAVAKGIMDSIADHVTGGKRRQFALDNSEILSSRKFIEAYNQAASAIIGRRPRDLAHAVRVGAYGDLQQAIGSPGFALLQLFDMEAAVLTWTVGYNQATKKLGYSHKEAKRYADDLVVRSQGSTMPGDLSGAQRNALGKVVTQFQTFLISDAGFVWNEVLTKGKPGGGGGGQIPSGGVASGTGSWESGSNRSSFQMFKNILRLAVYTQMANEFYKQLHIQPAQPDPVEDVRKGLAAGRGIVGLAFDVLGGQSERIPVWGGTRYGKGITGAAFNVILDLARGWREDPLARNPYQSQFESLGFPSADAAKLSKIAEPAATLFGIPGTRQASKYFLAQRRGENVYDSLMGWYSQERSSGGRSSRGERRSRPSR